MLFCSLQTMSKKVDFSLQASTFFKKKEKQTSADAT